ncbi:MAG: TOBE domain-containing protein [Steroidobacteraceae bacterium]
MSGTGKPRPPPATGTLDLQGNLSLGRDGQGFLGAPRIRLLEAIAEHGSITRAAKAVKLSYKGAWDSVEAMNNLAEQPLVKRSTGGAQGGGTQLTDYGRQVVQLYRELERGHRRVLDRLHAELDEPQRLAQQLQALSLRTSARNQWRGTVSAVRRGSVNADVVLDLGQGLSLCANITLESVRELGLKRGRAALALIKANFVTLAALPMPRVSARNRLTGTVLAIKPGAVNSEVKLELAGGRILVAIVDQEQLQQLGLHSGAQCAALINAAHVLVAVND